MARLRGELKELPSSCGGSLAVSLTVSRSKSELSRLSKKSLLPTLCTMMSQELTERVQHIRVAKMASVAKTLPWVFASLRMTGIRTVGR
uniref:Uncharacterized protein n=1 Tax=Anguilla anguilla TaxID=7936 RepID=A0A0E9WWB9_ANGAN